MILQQLDEMKKLEARHKTAQHKAKQAVKKLQEDLKEASSLFQKTLDVKLAYEKVIVKLVDNPVTKDET